MGDSRTLVVTGASSGIGEATARAAVAVGWNVVLAARSLDKLEALAGELGTGSVAGRRPIVGSLYSATKHAVHAMAEAARLELAGTGVRVTVIAPGMVDTPFFAKVPLDVPLVRDDVARAVLYALEQPAHVDVNEILVRPTAQEL